MKQKLSYALLAIAISAMTACGDQPAKQTEQTTETKQPGVREENITYTGDNTTMNGFVAFDSSR